MVRQHDEDQQAVRRSRWITVTVVLSGLLLIPLAPAAYWGVVNYVPPFHAESPALPQPNGYEVAFGAIRGVNPQPSSSPESLLERERWRTLPLRTLASSLRKRRTALAAVRAAFALEWRVPDPLEGEGVDYDGAFRECGAWFAGESRRARSRGDYDTAMQHCLDAIEVGARACRGGDMGDRFVGQDCQVRGLVEAQLVVWDLPMTRLPQHLARVRRLRATWPPTTETIEVERLQARKECVAFLEELRGKTPWDQAAIAQPTFTSLATPLGGAPSGAWWPAWRQVLTPRTVTLTRLDDFFHELAAASARPAPNGVPVPELPDLWASQFEDTSCRGCYRGEWPRHNLALLETALALRLHRLEHDAYPASLAEISPRWLPEVPRDVWDQPVRYLRRQAKPVVYSLGPDGVDDRARAVDPSSLISAGRGDSVFGKLCESDWPR